MWLYSEHYPSPPNSSYGIIIFKFLKRIYFFYCQSYREIGETESYRSSNHWFPLQVEATAISGPVWSHPGLPCMWVSRAETLRLSLAGFCRPLAGSWIATWADVHMRCWYHRSWCKLLSHNTGPCILISLYSLLPKINSFILFSFHDLSNEIKPAWVQDVSKKPAIFFGF